jgi:hypothetical protein
MNDQDKTRSRQGRIPATLQAVFLASNRGKDVNKPPPEKVASKVYFRNWLFQRQSGSKESRGSLFAGMGSKKNKKSKKSKSQPESKVVKTPKPKVCNVERMHYTLHSGKREQSLSMCQHFLTLDSLLNCSS